MIGDQLKIQDRGLCMVDFKFTRFQWFEYDNIQYHAIKIICFDTYFIIMLETTKIPEFWFLGIFSSIDHVQQSGSLDLEFRYSTINSETSTPFKEFIYSAWSNSFNIMIIWDAVIQMQAYLHVLIL